MSVSCPGCGGVVELTERSVPAQAGACPNCQREVLLLLSRPATATLQPETGEEEKESEESATAGLSVPHPGDDCDGTIVLELAAPDRLVGLCDDCGEEFAFVLSTGAPAEAEESSEEERPRRRFERPAFRTARPREDRDDDRPPARPCRQCGGPLRFDTDEDGNVTGHCDSCGNTFTLPKRREGGGREYGGGRRMGGGGFRPSAGRRPYRPRGPPRGDRDDRRRGGRRPPRDD